MLETILRTRNDLDPGRGPGHLVTVTRLSGRAAQCRQLGLIALQSLNISINARYLVQLHVTKLFLLTCVLRPRILFPCVFVAGLCINRCTGETV